MRRVIVVGFSTAVLEAAERFAPNGTILFVEAPDVAANRNVPSRIEASPARPGLLEFDYHDPDSVDRFHAEHRNLAVAAVIPGEEYAVRFAARLATRFGVPGAGTAAADAMCDKHLLRTVTEAAGIRNPASIPVTGPAQVRSFAARHGGSVIIKPTNRQGSLGAHILHPGDDVEAAWQTAFAEDSSMLSTRHCMPMGMLVEEFVTGQEYTVELLVRQRQVVFANVSQTLLLPGPRPVEVGHVAPADLPAPAAQDLIEASRAVAAATGFDTGYLHCEWIVDENGPCLVECAGRMPGNSIVELVSYAWATDLVRRYFELMTGRPIGPTPARPALASAIYFGYAHEGTVARVDGVEAARAVPGVGSVVVSVQPGDQVRPPITSTNRTVSAIGFGHTSAAALATAQAAAGRVRVVVHEPAAGSAVGR